MCHPLLLFFLGWASLLPRPSTVVVLPSRHHCVKKFKKMQFVSPTLTFAGTVSSTFLWVSDTKKHLSDIFCLISIGDCRTRRASYLDKLQRAQNNIVFLIFHRRKADCGPSASFVGCQSDLGWITRCQPLCPPHTCVNYRGFNTLVGLPGPHALSFSLSHDSDRRDFCSFFKPAVWNSLPHSLRLVSTFQAFKSFLKTHLFKKFLHYSSSSLFVHVCHGFICLLTIVFF